MTDSLVVHFWATYSNKKTHFYKFSNLENFYKNKNIIFICWIKWSTNNYKGSMEIIKPIFKVLR